MKISTIKAYLRNTYLFLTGKFILIKPDVIVEKAWIGNMYGGFYIYPNNLNKQSIVYSFGIGEDVSFDQGLIRKYGCQVYGFDPTPKSIAWVKEQKLPQEFLFQSYGIGIKTGKQTFFLPQNENYVSGSLFEVANVNKKNPIEVPIKSFSDIIEELGHKTIHVLKMDIEGAEYDILPTILNSSVTIDQILIEFHHRMIPDGKAKTLTSIKLLKENGFELFAISDSNEEMSFINRNV